jgi:epoxyqueuosine reductase
VQEKVYAWLAGLGWIGKNACVINPGLGSWILLGVLACNAELQPDEPALDQCGTCRLCLDACPTGAFVEPQVLDARRCLSYLTIEVRGSIPAGQRSDVGAHVFGCDICQDVCPYNAQAPSSRDACWQPKAALRDATLGTLWANDDAALEREIAGTALRRAGVRGLRRNLAVAIGNAGPPLIDLLEQQELSEAIPSRPSLDDPMVAEHINWARSRHR